jgi:lysozyme
MDQMKLNKAGIDLIKEFEGFRSKPYLDVAGIPTIGYGTTTYPDTKEDVKLTDPPISEVDAERFLRLDCENFVQRLKYFVEQVAKLPLTDNEFSALIVFSYNLGLAPCLAMGRSMNKAIKSKDKQTIANTFLIYNKATVAGEKVVVPGLTRRRLAEQKLFLTP